MQRMYNHGKMQEPESSLQVEDLQRKQNKLKLGSEIQSQKTKVNQKVNPMRKNDILRNCIQNVFEK